MCEHALDDHDRHVRFVLPDPVLDLPAAENTTDTWMSHDSANESVMMQVPHVGAFVRALLPVNLTGGHTVTFGVWLAIDPKDLQSVFATWWEPEYSNLRLQAWLANSVPPWGLLFEPVVAGVRDPEQTPYCESSPRPELDRVLNDLWPHDVVLDALQ